MWGWISTPRVLATAAAVLALGPAFEARAQVKGACSPERDRNQVARTLDELHAAAARADGRAYFALYAPTAVFVGTDVGERWTLDQFRVYAQPYFDQGKGWRYKPRSRSIVLSSQSCSEVAWFDEVLDSASYGTTRGSGVLVKRPDGWRVAQYVLSFPVPNAIAKSITDQIKAHEGQGPQKAP